MYYIYQEIFITILNELYFYVFIYHEIFNDVNEL